MKYFILLVSILSSTAAISVEPIEDNRFSYEDVFELEFATDPRISPDGRRVVYVRRFMDINTDRVAGHLWLASSDGSKHRPLTGSQHGASSPRWSPDGRSIFFVSSRNGSSQIYRYWLDSGLSAPITRLKSSPSGLSISPDGQRIAFSMFIKEKSKPLFSMPDKPDGAEWVGSATVVDTLLYRADGQGFLEDGYSQLFVVSTDGGTARQLTSGKFHHNGTLAWTNDSRDLVFSANRSEDWAYNPVESELYRINVDSREVTQLTTRNGPDSNPAVSPDGTRIAYTGFDDQQHGYQVRRLYVVNVDGSNRHELTSNLDRDVITPQWDRSGRYIYFRYDDNGQPKIGRVNLDGSKVDVLVSDMGGNTIGRPYSNGSFTVGRSGDIAYTTTRTDRPADVKVRTAGGRTRQLTDLNTDVLGHKKLGRVEEIHYASSHDEKQIQGWIVYPPDYDASKKYPFILEIHGGPFANYGPHFSVEVQSYAAAGYIVLYTNPRGSTSYGKAFGNLIHHAYPSHDYDDLMSGVDEVIKRGLVDEDRLFVTGGSGGGTLSAWIVGHTDRFRAAVVQKPVINWYSFVLYADFANFFYRYWFPGYPWDHQEQYMQRSPISYAGNVTTPTMLLTGEADDRTPMPETEQFYQALKLRKVDTVMVRIPDTPHNIAGRPSTLISKVGHILKWFELHDVASPPTDGESKTDD